MFTQKYFARPTDYKTKRKIYELGSGRHRKQRDEIHLREIWDCFSFVVLCFLFFSKLRAIVMYFYNSH